jgi:hypothetical protein
MGLDRNSTIWKVAKLAYRRSVENRPKKKAVQDSPAPPQSFGSECVGRPWCPQPTHLLESRTIYLRQAVLQQKI